MVIHGKYPPLGVKVKKKKYLLFDKLRERLNKTLFFLKSEIHLSYDEFKVFCTWRNLSRNFNEVTP